MRVKRESVLSPNCLFNLDRGSMSECFAFYLMFSYHYHPITSISDVGGKKSSSHTVLKRTIQNGLYDIKHLLSME
jgi:hypothetical protein